MKKQLHSMIGLSVGLHLMAGTVIHQIVTAMPSFSLSMPSFHSPVTQSISLASRPAANKTSIRQPAKRLTTDSALKPPLTQPKIADSVQSQAQPNKAVQAENTTEASAASSAESTTTSQTMQPDYAYNPLPEYPLLMREQGIGGTVWLKAWVDSRGLPHEIKIMTSSGYRLLDEAASRAARQWRFVPAKQGQQVLASWVAFPVRFSVDG